MIKALLLPIALFSTLSFAEVEEKAFYCDGYRVNTAAGDLFGVVVYSMSIKGNGIEVAGSPTIWIKDRKEYYALYADQDYILEYDRQTRRYRLNGKPCR